jgi:SET domain-containing protein
MLLVPTFIMQSERHGIGLFAACSIPVGKIIASHYGRLDLSFGTSLQAIHPPTLRDFVRHYGYHDKVDLLWYLPGDNLRFINHSDQPNVIQDGIQDVAARDIAEGEELLVDYYAFDLDAPWKLRELHQ